ncbi:hypothetical protein AGMMS49936_09670 [Endomicrobiia bacterium]|nr:hypothetical protein AGMMS49936_09670 [Endomicrobiia bacterium]
MTGTGVDGVGVGGGTLAEIGWAVSVVADEVVDISEIGVGVDFGDFGNLVVRGGCGGGGGDKAGGVWGSVFGAIAINNFSDDIFCKGGSLECGGGGVGEGTGGGDVDDEVGLSSEGVGGDDDIIAAEGVEVEGGGFGGVLGVGGGSGGGVGDG